MHWIAPPEKDTDSGALEMPLRDAADQFRANSGLKSQECSAPVLGLIFLRFAEVRFTAKRAQLDSPSPLGGKRAEVRGGLEGEIKHGGNINSYYDDYSVTFPDNWFGPVLTQLGVNHGERV